MANIGTATLFFTGDLGALTASMNRMKSQAAQAGKEAGGSFGTRFGAGLSSQLQNIVGMVGGMGAVTMLGKTAVEMAKLGDQVKRQRAYFDVYAGSAGEAARTLNLLRKATQGAVSETDLLNAANKYTSMGLSTNAEETAKLARMAVTLGGSTRTASESMEEFALLLANQSIQRLDTFGISSARVRARIDELTAADKNLTHEQAFMNAVMEEGEVKIAALDAAGVPTVDAFDKLAAAIADTKIALADLTAPTVVPWVETLTDRIRNNLIPNLEYLFKIRPRERAYGQAFERYATVTRNVEEAQKWLNRALAEGDKFQTQAAQAALDGAKANLELVAAQYAGAQAEAAQTTQNDKLAESYNKVTKAIGGTAVTTAATAVLSPASPFAMGFVSSNQYGEPENIDITNLPQALQREYEDERTTRMQKWLDRWEMQNKTANTEIQDTWKSTSSDIIGMFTAAQSASIGLSDLRGLGGGMLTAPGANGAFEDIYRLQAWVKDQSWGETATKFGITSKEDAAERIRKFQTGMWDKSVSGLIDEEKLKQGIISEKQATAYKQAFAQKIAAATGENTDVISATIFGDASGNTNTQTQRMTTTGVDLAGGLIRGVIKAQPDLETEGYNAAMSYRAGWNRGASENNTGISPPSDTGSAIIQRGRSNGLQIPN